MIHRYKNNGYNIVLDVNSGSVHVVDEIVYDMVGLLDEGKSEKEILASLEGRYQEQAYCGEGPVLTYCPRLQPGMPLLFCGGRGVSWTQSHDVL